MTYFHSCNTSDEMYFSNLLNRIFYLNLIDDIRCIIKLYVYASIMATLYVSSPYFKIPINEANSGVFKPVSSIVFQK